MARTALERLSDQRHRLRAITTLVGGAAFATAAAFGWMLGEVFWASDFGAGTDAVSGTLGAASTIAGAALVVLLSYALTQALPRTLAVANPERLGLSTAGYALAMTRLLYPLARALGAPWKWGVSVAGGQPDVSPWAVTPEWRGADSDERAEREGAEEALLEAVSDFADKVVREVMVPRTDTKALPDTATASDAVALIAEDRIHAHPRLSLDDRRRQGSALCERPAEGDSGQAVSTRPWRTLLGSRTSFPRPSRRRSCSSRCGPGRTSPSSQTSMGAPPAS